MVLTFSGTISDSDALWVIIAHRLTEDTEEKAACIFCNGELCCFNRNVFVLWTV